MKSTFLHFFIFLQIFYVHLFGQVLDSYFGVQTHFGQFWRSDMDSSNMISMLDSVKAAGINIIRDECLWSEVEKTKGFYTFPNAIDNYVNAANERGIKILFILNYNNTLYASANNSNVSTDSNRTAFANYCKAVVERYSPLGVKLYEIWNEPNIPWFWEIPNAKEYVDLIKVAYPAIKEIDSTAIVIIGATSPAEGEPSPFIDWLTYFNSIKDNGGLDYMDAVSFHFYRFNGGPENWLNSDINNIVNIVGSNRDMYITEIGYPTSSVWPAISLENQAKYIARLWIMGRKYEHLKMISYYDLKDDGLSKEDPEQNFGILNFDTRAKPAFNSYRTVISSLANKQYISSQNEGNNYQYIFREDNNNIYATWSKTSSSNITFPIETNRLKITTMLGKFNYFYDIDKSFDADLTDAPIYIEEIDDFPNIVDCEIHPQLVNIVVGQTIPLIFIGLTENGYKISLDSSSAVIWEFSNTKADINRNGILSANEIGGGNIIAKFEGKSFEKWINIIPQYNYYEIESFDSLSNFNYTFFNMNDTTKLTISEADYTTAPTSLKIDYKFKYSALPNHRIYFDCNYPLVGEPDSILIDIYNNNNGHAFSFEITDRHGNVFAINPSAIETSQGWQTIRKPLNSIGADFKYPLFLTRYTFYAVQQNAVSGETYSGTIHLDNLRIHGSQIVSVNNKNFRNSFEHKLELKQNYPNPFNPNTTIEYTIPSDKENAVSLYHVNLKVYDIVGREVITLVDEKQNSGSYEVQFSIVDGNAPTLSSGIYFYQLIISTIGRQVGSLMVTKKMILIK